MRQPETGIETQPSFLSRIHERFVYGVYEDLQDFIFDTHGAPSIVYIREDQDTVRPCFPRGRENRYRGFCDFCKLVRKSFGKDGELSPCVRNEISYIRDGILAEEDGVTWNWGWQRCHMGLLDYYAPIRSIDEKDGNRPIVAVLMFGHYRAAGSDSLKLIGDNIRAALAQAEHDPYFAQRTEDEWKQIASSLISLIHSIPQMTDDKRVDLTDKLKQIISLVEIIATHTLRAGTLHDGDRFVRELRFELGDARITEPLFCKALQNGLREIVDYLNLESGIAYKSNSQNYAWLMPLVTHPANLHASSPLTVPSLTAFRELMVYPGMDLPDRNPGLTWLTPDKLVGSKNATLFAHETVSGHLLLTAFGHGKKVPNAFQRAVLVEVVREKLIPFIESTISILDIDMIMREVGHLLGRTRADIKAGYDNLEDVNRALDIPNLVDATRYEKKLRDGRAAIEEGIVKLNLIRHNFYSFRQVRTEDEEELHLIQKPVDIVKLLDKEIGFYRQALTTSPISRINYVRSIQRAEVMTVRERMELVFLNLFDNMCKFAYNDTYATILIRGGEQNCVIVEFINLGLGVAPDETEVIFQPQAKSRFNDPSKRKEGIGMGLTFCRRVVEKECGGKISLSSEPVKTKRIFEGDKYITTVTVSLRKCG